MKVNGDSPMNEPTAPSTAAGVPKREFGNTGVRVSQLCLGGGSFMGAADGQSLLEEALKYGVDCWEIVSFTGHVYREYFERHPAARERVFLSSKVYSTNPATMQEHLDKTLQENGVSCIDFLAVHAIDDIAALTDDIRKWAEKAKQDKKIRFFGFCTHKNMDQCLDGGADLGWIDGIQTVYNYRLQRIASMEDGLRKCHENGKGLFTIKSMGLPVLSDAELQKSGLDRGRMNSRLTQYGVSFEQAKLRAVWQNPHVSSVCSLMPDKAILQSNVLAAMDERPLGDEVRRVLSDYADATAGYYCSRCGACETANADQVPIFTIMELLMYARSYGMGRWSAQRFAQLPIGIRSKLTSSDYTTAEARCPQKMAIAQLMKEACLELNGTDLHQ